MGLEDFAVAMEEDGVPRVRQRLLATHNIRMVKCGKLPPNYLAECWPALKYVGFCYIALNRSGHDINQHPSEHDEWPAQLRWGLDSIQQSVRLLFSGQVTASAVIARLQLERWTLNLAYNTKVERRAAEPIEDFVDRVWRYRQARMHAGDEADLQGTDVVLEGRRVNPRVVMKTLNKVAHAEVFSETIEWTNRGFAEMPSEAPNAARLVVDALILAAEQIRTCTLELVRASDHAQAARIADFRLSIPKFSMSPLPPSLWPANLLLIQEGAWEPVKKRANDYNVVLNGGRPAGRLYTDPEMMELSFTHFRNRCIRFSKIAFDIEAEKTGPLTQGHLMEMEIPSVMTSEMAAALAQWLPKGSAMRAAAAAIADAIRSTYWLWLEDDMRSMAALRVVLEQTARLRVWRLKPQRAPYLEASGSPATWLEKAGWKRLYPLNRALGELSHFRPDVNWGGAYELLVLLNPHVSQEEAPFTARRHALEIMTRLVSKEIREIVRSLNVHVADGFDEIAAEIFTGGPAVDLRIEKYLARTHGYLDVNLPTEYPPRTSFWQSGTTE